MKVTIQSRWITTVLVMITSRKATIMTIMTTIMLIMTMLQQMSITTMLQQMSITTKIIAVFPLNKNSAYIRSIFLMVGLALLSVVFNKTFGENIEFILIYLLNLFFQSYMKLSLELNSTFKFATCFLLCL